MHNDELKRLKKQKKRLEEMQHGAAKKLKKDFTKKSTSSPTGEKGPVPMANSQRKGKNVVPMANSQRVGKKPIPMANSQQKMANSQREGKKPIPMANSQQKMANSQREGKKPIPMANSQQKMSNSQREGKKSFPIANSQQKGEKAVPTETTRSQFATNVSRKPVVKSWYNKQLKERDIETWDKFNGCFRAIQSSDSHTAFSWLLQLERAHFSHEERNYILEKSLRAALQLVNKLVFISPTSKSEILTTKKRRRTSLEPPLNGEI